MDQANEIREITTAQFENLLKVQTHDTRKWADLEINKIYRVTHTRMVPTKNGQAMILSLLNNGEVWAPEHWKNKIMKSDTYFNPPFHFRPLGLKPCKDNPRNKNHSYDLVFSSPEPNAPGELIGWEGSVVRRPSVVRPQFQTTSPLKLLGRLQLNFIYSLQGF